MQELQKGPKACTTCAKAKARCIPRPAGDKCERCYRLSKDCFSRAPAPPRIKKRPKRSRVAELEKRLNELSSQFEGHGPASHHLSITSLHTQQQQTPTPTPTTATLPIPIPASSSKPVLARVADKGEIMNLEHLFPSPSSSGPDSHDAFAWTPDARRATTVEATWPLFGDDEGLLQQYHELFAHLFPFVVVPPHLTSAELRRDRPFLWKAVMLASSLFDGVRQARMGEELLAETAKAAVVHGVKSLDLLQALQLLVAWFYFALKSSQVINLLFLARSMCVNLGSVSPLTLDEDKNERPDLDRMRAFAGTYYLNTLILTTNKRTDVFMNTTHLDACCKVLELHREFPSDEYLVRLVKVQQLTQAISTTMAMEPAMQAMSLPLTMVVESFQDQLDTFHATLPAHLADNAPLQCHIYVAKVLLMDVAISDEQCTASHVSITDRLQLLSACIRSLRNFFRVRFAASELERPRFLALITSDLAFAFITGIKLLTLRAPGWNVERVGQDLALDHILARQIQDLSAMIAKRKAGEAILRRRSSVATIPPDDPLACSEDPLERLLRLLRTAQELVALQLTGVSAQEIAQEIVQEMDSSVWQDLVNDAAWSAPPGILQPPMMDVQ